ncbi:MAG: hypothetical protein BWY62_01323 [Firmicutes bacterium ADurb.Bin356]|nr:MAG: hypothetical protein BWY62_01323 [Firmicutes bacterium ADurb.Bin356]
MLYGRPHFHISLVVDVSPYCDCHSGNDAAIVPDLGMFASFDPVALDVACADAVNNAAPVLNSMLGEVERKGDCFSDLFPITDWRTCIEHAVKLNIGSSDYKLIKV